MTAYTIFIEAGAAYGVMSVGDSHAVVRAERGPLGFTLTPVEAWDDFTTALDRADILNALV